MAAQKLAERIASLTNTKLGHVVGYDTALKYSNVVQENRTECTGRAQEIGVKKNGAINRRQQIFPLSIMTFIWRIYQDLVASIRTSVNKRGDLQENPEAASLNSINFYPFEGVLVPRALS